MDNLIGNAINNIKNVASNLFGGFNQPQIQSPVPQAQTMAPQMSPLQQFAANAGNFAQQQFNIIPQVQLAQRVGQGMGNYFNPANVGSANNPTPNFWTTPVAQGLGQAQQFIESPTHTQIVPTINPFKGTGLPQTIGNSIANIPGQLTNTVVGQGILDPAFDIGQNIGRTIAGREPLQYNQAKSPLTRLGYQVAGVINPDSISDYGTQTNPLQVVGNAAEAAMPIASVYGGGKVFGIGKDAAEQVASQTIGQAALQGLKSGAGYGGFFGALQGLAQSRNSDVKQAIYNVLTNTAIGIAGGAAIGAASSIGGNVVGQILSAITSIRMKQGVPQAQAQQDAQTYLRDRAGRFLGVGNKDTFQTAGLSGKVSKPGQAIGGNWMDQVDKQIGWDKNNQPSVGLAVKTLSKEEHDANVTKGIEDTIPNNPEPVIPQTQSSQVPGQAPIPLPTGENAQVGTQSSPVLPQGSNPAQQVVAGSQSSDGIIAQGKNRGLVDSTQEAQNVSGVTKPLVQGTYTPKANTQLMGEAKGLLEQGTNLDLKGVPNVDQKVAATIQEAINQDGAGNHEAAANLINNLAKQGTELGRGVQAFSLINKLSPEAYSLSAAKLIQDYNRTARVKIPELTAEQQGMISDAVANIKTLPEGSREQGMAIQKLTDTISRFIPSSLTSKTMALWRTGLLTGPQTVSKIVVSHGVMSAMEGIKNIPAAALDKAISLITGTRSMTLTSGGYVSGARKGILAGVDNLVHGYNAPDSGGVAQDFRNKVNFGDSLFGKAAQVYVDTVGRVHGSLYKPFYGAAHMNSLYDQALTEANNQGLKGALKEDFVTNFMKVPPENALKVAQRDAEMATFQQKTALGTMASAVQQKGGVLGKIVVPFTKIPSAILTDVLNYSPVGAVKSIAEGIQRGQFTQDSQRQLVQGLGRAVTGTGILFLGGLLYNKGMIALDKPTTPKEAAQWDLEGKKPQSVLINGQWKSLGALGPLGHALAIGGYFEKGMNDINTPGLGNALETTAAGAGKTTLDQSYLMGMSNLTSAIQNPAQNAKYEAQSLASSVIPTGIGTVARAIDPLQRQVNTVPDALSNKIPILRQGLLPKTDVLGNQVQRSGGVVQNILDPFASSDDTSGTATNNPVTTELGRLTAVGQSATPTKLTANQTINGVKQKLTPAQLDTLNQQMGPQIQSMLSTLIASPQYQGLTDEQKKNAIDTVITQVRTQVRGNSTIDTSGSLNTSTTPTSSNNVVSVVNPDTGKVTKLDLNRGDTTDTSPAALKQQATADANAIKLIQSSQVFNLKSSLTAQAAMQLIYAAGGNPQQAYFGAVAGLPSPQQAKFVQSYLGNPQNGDFQTRINTLVSNNVLNTSTVTAMNKNGLINLQTANALKQEIAQYAVNAGTSTGGGSSTFNGAQRIKNQIRSSITRQRHYKVKRAKAPKMVKFKVKMPKLAQISMGTPQKKFKVKGLNTSSV